MGIIEVAAEVSRARRVGPQDVTVSVLLADEHALFAEVLQSRLAREPDLYPVSVVLDAAELRRRLPRDRPDVVVLDPAFGDGSGLALAEHVRDTVPHSRVLMLTDLDATGPVLEALRLGVRAWLPRTIRPAQLVRAIRGVSRGEGWLPPDLLGTVLTALARPEAGPRDPLAVLTAREREVLQCLVDGMSRGQIARRLHLSTNMVRTHTQNMLTKLGVHSTLESVALAMRCGLRVTVD